jgi:hypothetical protein
MLQREISALIKEIQGGIDNAVGAMDKGTEQSIPDLLLFPILCSLSKRS